MRVADEAELARLPGIDGVVPGRSRPGAGDTAGTHGTRELAIGPGRADGPPHPRRRFGAVRIGVLGRRRPRAAYRGYTAASRACSRAGHIADVLGCSITLADIRITQGRLGDALSTYEQRAGAGRPPNPVFFAARPTCTSG